MNSAAPPIHETLERLRLSLSQAPSDWAETLHLTENEYRAVIAGRKHLQDQALTRLCDRFGLSPQALREGTIDFRSTARIGMPSALPERFLNDNHSRLRTVISLLDGVEDLVGWKVRLELMSGIGLNERMLQDPMTRCSVNLITELCRKMESEYEIGKEGLYQFGAYSTVTHQTSLLARQLSTCRSPRAVYERMFTSLTGLYEFNFEYRIRSLSDTYCVVELWPTPEALAAHGGRPPGTADLCSVRGGVMASLTCYQGLPMASVSEIQCVHRGGACCVFDIDYELAEQSRLTARKAEAQAQQ